MNFINCVLTFANSEHCYYSNEIDSQNALNLIPEIEVQPLTQRQNIFVIFT